MATFETLIFIPEGSLLNEKLAEKNCAAGNFKTLWIRLGTS